MKRKILLSMIFLIFIAGAVFTGFQIIRITGQYRTSDQLYAQLQSYAVVPDASGSGKTTEPEETEGTAATEETENVTLVYPEVDFESLLQVNRDVVGWLYIEGTNINYPVVQGMDNRHYVSTLIDGTYNDAGSIFMDYRNSRELADPHTVLYGHNMQNGSMFHDICNYRTQDYYDKHPMGMIVTPEKNYYFEIISGYVASLADPSWQLEFVDDADLMNWVEDSVGRSSVVSQAEPQPGDRIITLTTCSYEFNNARFVLVGILREE